MGDRDIPKSELLLCLNCGNSFNGAGWQIRLKTLSLPCPVCYTGMVLANVQNAPPKFTVCGNTSLPNPTTLMSINKALDLAHRYAADEWNPNVYILKTQRIWSGTEELKENREKEKLASIKKFMDDNVITVKEARDLLIQIDPEG